MLKRATARSSKASAAPAATDGPAKPASPIMTAADQPQAPDEVVERVRLKVPNAHVFKLPPKPSAGGWRGAEWRDKVWQGTLKVVERGEETAVLLVDSKEEKNIFAVCPIRHNLDGKTNVGNGVDRCIDSSRYFVLRIQNAQGRHLFIGLAFNERNDAFDFNTALEDSRREKELERRAAALGGGAGGDGNATGGNVNYKMKEGEKIRVSIPRIPNGGSNGEDGGSPGSGGGGPAGASAAARRKEARKARQASGNAGGGGFLKPSSKDTPSRLG
ncbi:hypothetical protein ACHAXT_002779 [Thalassiosira profunda]